MADDKTRVVETDQVKDVEFVEISPYRSLSPEDADFMRSYEGTKDKKVVRKVRHNRCNG